MTGTAFAELKNTGCGLGSVVFEGKDGLLSEISAVTTNGTLGNQTFGITSGTSNCDKPASFASNAKLNKFVAENMDNLATDMAQGSGEYLETLATLMEVPQAEKSALYARLQQNFARIYTSASVSATDILNHIEVLVTAG